MGQLSGRFFCRWPPRGPRRVSAVRSSSAAGALPGRLTLAFTGVDRLAPTGTARFFDLAPQVDALVVHGCWERRLSDTSSSPPAQPGDAQTRTDASYRTPSAVQTGRARNPRAGNPALGYPYQVHRRNGICRRRRLRDSDGLPLTAPRSIVIDLNTLLRRHQLSLMVADRPMTPREKRAHEQFAREISEQIARTRAALGAGRALPGSVT